MRSKRRWLRITALVRLEEVIELDKSVGENLHHVLDVAGADKLVRFKDGGVCFLAQRFRRSKYLRYDDFTLRRTRPSGQKTEAGKIVDAFERNGLVAAYYAYALVNKLETGFLRFRLFDFWRFCGMWLEGVFPPDELKWNKDGSSSFYVWSFDRFPNSLWKYNSEPYQHSFL